MPGMDKTFRTICIAASIFMSLFHLYTAYFGSLPGLEQRSFHLAFILLVGLCFYPASKSQKNQPLYYLNVAMAIAGFAVCLYVFMDYYEITQRIGAPTTTDIILGSLGIIILLELTRRVIGPTIPIAVVLFILYAFFGAYLPPALGHAGYDLPGLINHIYLTTEGIFGSALGVCATYVIVFVILGSFMKETKAADIFIDLAYSLFGRLRGGPAKSAVVASGLFGMVSGSSVANVMSVGTFTIPMMKQIGFRPYEAGAIEAISSTGGQLMPPVMGAAAFIMAEILGVPYIKICLVAAIPAFLYYLNLFTVIHQVSVKRGLRGMPREKLPKFLKVMKEGWYLVAVPIILVYLLGVESFSPSKSGFFTLIGLLLIILVVKRGTLKAKGVLTALEKGFTNIISVSVACAAAGILTGIFSLTGLGLKLSSMLITLSGGNLLVLLLLTMVTSFILGCGIPTVPCYMILATLIAPALVKMNVNPFAAHLFIFYFGMISHITPPVAIAAYASAGLAEAPFMKTGWTAFRLGLPVYIIPYVFVYNPFLMMLGTFTDVLTASIKALVIVTVFGFAVEGRFLTRLSPIMRALSFIGPLFLVSAELTTNVIGYAIILIFLAWEGYRFLGNRKEIRQPEIPSNV